MALFNKLFFPSSSSSPATPSANNNNKRNNNQTFHSKNYISQFPFDAGQVRVLLFRECDSRGRRLLFDSNALQKVTLKDFEIRLSTANKISDENINVQSSNNSGKHNFKSHLNGYVEASDGCLYKHNRPSMADIPTIGEMVFGALAMSFRGTALKVHWLRSPPRMLCSQVFLSPMTTVTNSTTSHHVSTGHLTPRNSITSEHGSVDGFSMNSFSMLSVDRKNSDISDRLGDRFTNPLDVPDANVNITTAKRHSATYSTGDSGYSGGTTTSSDQWTVTTGSLSYQYSTRSSLGSVISDPESMRKFSLDSTSYLASATQSSNLSSYGSLQRRISRNLLTSFENQNSFNDFIGFLSDNNFHTHTGIHQTTGGSEGCVAPHYRRNTGTNESRSNPEIGRRRGDINFSHKMSRRPRLGLAVCITMSESFEDEMEMFCSEHIALLESMLGRLRISSEEAYINHKEFLKIMVHAWQTTTQWLLDLFKAPRINVPVWLSITTSGSKYSKSVADRFVHELCSLLSMADTKNTNFFVSTILTAVLTHHLGWVSTISNLNSPTKSSAAATEQRAKLLEISQKYPYNVLWAQIGDLYGAVGTPPKLSRTIIYGTEKLPTERLLNILTYFIRCGEIRRTSKSEDFNKEIINDIIMNQNNDQNSAKTKSSLSKPTSRVASSHSLSSKDVGLTRIASCKTDLAAMCMENENDDDDSIEYNCKELNISRMNDIPNVLAFRDSRFVQQELRIGNFLMDPGIVKSSLTNLTQEDRQGERIKLTVTTPENIEMTVEPIETETSGVVEAIEIDLSDEIGQTKNSSTFFWSPVVKEGVSCSDFHKLPINQKLEKRSTSFNSLKGMSDLNLNPQLKRVSEKHISLSDLITENSIGKGNRLAWGAEAIRENPSCTENEVKYFDNQKAIMNQKEENDNKGVVFVLGDNEPLVNIKRSTEDLIQNVDLNPTVSLSSSPKKQVCPHHSYHNSHKKHSGVKFDFAQYPQIYANYMKNKNLSDFDFMEKPQKFEMFSESSAVAAGTSALAATATATATANLENLSMTSEFCEFCQNSTNGNKSYQTPSNATELEFDTDDDHSVYNNQPPIESNINPETLSSSSSVASTEPPKNIAKLNGNRLRKSTDLNLVVLPIPGIKEQQIESSLAKCDIKLRAGFIPSLFLGINDHYIPDMVLQGTSAPPHKWEINLREDLALATHSASLISMPAENVAVIADMDNWDVKIISCQNQTIPFSSVVSGPVGMSQLVASMLETVYTMNSSGIPSYECLSFLESKLHEIYMHSESLASFLLATDFCSLSSVTTALNLTENDVPLLLSIASIHTPQITKKCGISFR